MDGLRQTNLPSADRLLAFLESRLDTCNAASIATYRAYLAPFMKWLDGRSISAMTVSAYLFERRARKCASATVTNATRILKTFCRWLVEQGELETDPFSGPGRVRTPAQRRKRREVYSEEQVVQLLVTAQTQIDERRCKRAARSPNPFRFRDAVQARALIVLLCDSALRAAEVCALDCRQVRMDEFIVLGKGGHMDPAFVTDMTRAILRELAGDRPDDEPLFRDIHGKRCTTRALRGCLQRLAEVAQVPLVERPLHAFRHLAARNWLKSGLGDLTIRQLMRHSTLATTRIYTELDATELAALHATASPISRYLNAAEQRGSSDSGL